MAPTATPSDIAVCGRFGPIKPEVSEVLAVVAALCLGFDGGGEGDPKISSGRSTWSTR